MKEEFHADFSVFTTSSRLDRLLSQCFPQFSRALLQAWIKDGMVQVNERDSKPSHKLKPRARIHIRASFPIRAPDVPAAIQLNRVYEDEYLLIINKPPELIVHPGAGIRDGTLLNALLAHNSEQKYLPRAGLVHRLDRGTSGLLIIAKRAVTLLKLQQQLQRREIHRHYLALVEGVPISGDTIDRPLGRDPRNRLRFKAYSHKAPHTRPAITHYRIERKFSTHALLRASLETGRTHQIRCHLAAAGYPLVGDSLYGAHNILPPLEKFSRQALHAASLVFNHPHSQKEMTFTAPIPVDMQQLLGLLAAAS